MGFFSSLFGCRKSVKPRAQVEPIQYRELYIFSEAKAEQGQFRISGRICDAAAEPCQTHHFIRSDLLPTAESANELMIKKAKLYIDQNSGRIFNQ
ncbi:hypothetical protein VST7929_03190 [Vibrio stylophorae]|uniref:Transcriptional regulator n=1 Tax=Vibrio stylophorae TaxID=659351 RepID=A0ABN8DZM0_9VIBR|nr:HlyU family transcriptional regulator [Vibrio stylophorae]CAH0535710.1 hypothetical protein VST7929_03190 [Vibrio stylophorae]